MNRKKENGDMTDEKTMMMKMIRIVTKLNKNQFLQTTAAKTI